MRIELTPSAWKAEVLPLNYIRTKWSGRRDSNSRPSPWQGDALPLSHFRILFFKMVEGDGFEPSKAQLTDLQSAPVGHSGIPRRMLAFFADCFVIFSRSGAQVHQYIPLRDFLDFAHSAKNYAFCYWSWWRESNPQPADYKSAALPLSHTSEGTV